MKKIGKWIPVSSGRFPENNTVVQVTYLDPLDLHTLRCNAFAFYKEGIWYQSTDNRAMKGEVIAWRTNADVYDPELPTDGWIPAIQLPEEMKDVQVTLKSNLPPHHVMSAAFVYVYHGEWCWADDGSKVCVKVLAWKVNDDVYDPEADLEMKYNNIGEKIMRKIGKWIPVSSGKFPEKNSVVQVTYVDPLDQHTLRCNAFAFYAEGTWYKTFDYSCIKGKVIAWRENEDVCGKGIAWKKDEDVCHPELLINGWTPAIQTPPESKDVQVTFASYYPPQNPLIVTFAYFHNGKWYWSDNNGQVGVKILAWKINDDVYDSEVTLKEKYQDAIRTNMDELDFYMDLLADGFSVDLVRRLLGDEKADHMQSFCLNHGLLETNPIVDLFNRICEKLQKNVVENRHGIYTTDDEIICKKKEQANAIADLFEDMGVDVMHTSQEEDGWHVYFD